MVKACLVAITFLLAILVMRPMIGQPVHAQGSLEYKVVDVNLQRSTGSLIDKTKFYSLQDALDEHAAEGWKLVEARFYGRDDGKGSDFVILERRR